MSLPSFSLPLRWLSYVTHTQARIAIWHSHGICHLAENVLNVRRLPGALQHLATAELIKALSLWRLACRRSRKVIKWKDVEGCWCVRWCLSIKNRLDLRNDFSNLKWKKTLIRLTDFCRFVRLRDSDLVWNDSGNGDERCLAGGCKTPKRSKRCSKNKNKKPSWNLRILFAYRFAKLVLRHRSNCFVIYQFIQNTNLNLIQFRSNLNAKLTWKSACRMEPH